MEGGRRAERNYCTRRMAELPLVQVLQQQLAHVTSEREDLHWGGNCIKWLMRPFAETCRIWSSFAMHSICRISIRNSSKQFTTCPSNSKKQMSWFLDVSWYSWFWLAFCFSGLMHLWKRCSKRVGWRTWSSRRRLIQSKRRAEEDAARSLRASKRWVFDISKWAYAKLHLFSVCATQALETTEAQITELLASANVLSQVFWGPTDGRNDGCS